MLSCKYVDEVIIGTTSIITEDLLKSFNIQLVAEGFPHFYGTLPSSKPENEYKLAKERGIYREINLENKFTIDTIIERIIKNREKYLKFL